MVPPVSENLIKVRYAGITTNANRIGIITVSVIISSMYLVLENKHIPASVSAVALSFYMLWISASRTSAVAVILAALLYLFIVFRERKTDELSVKSALSCMFIALMLFGIILGAHFYSESLRQETAQNSENSSV